MDAALSQQNLQQDRQQALQQDALQDRAALIARSVAFLDEIKDMTTGSEVERWLNQKYGPDSELYRTLAGLIKNGVRDGWAANVEVDGPIYRRSRIADPSERTHHFSITAVYFDTAGNTQGHADQRYRGQYHGHPYGEFNLVIPLSPDAALRGPNGWCHAGWTAPAPGSFHYPEAKGGAVIALFFLPAGRIAYRTKESTDTTAENEETELPAD